MEIALLILGLIVGGTIGWLWAAARGKSSEGSVGELRGQVQKAEADLGALRAELDAERRARVEADTRLAEAAKNLEEQKALLQEAKQRLGDTFKALSDDALKSNNQAFLELARKSLDTVLAEARGDLGKRQEAIDGIVKPLQKSLKEYEEHIRAIEKERKSAYTGLDEQIKSLSGTSRQLEKETNNLVTALRTGTTVRGKWGEMTLRRVVELAGMQNHVDFDEQTHAATESGAQRPDMIVHLPAGRQIVVDAKISLEAYLDAVAADAEDRRKAFLQKHARHIRDHMNRLAQKSYFDQVEGAVDFTVMFVPGESFLAAALENDPALMEDGMLKRVVLATPTTLIALLRAVGYGWRQEQLAENARQISDLGKQLYDRMRVLAGHIDDVGKGITRATQAYNKAVGSIERRILPSARKFKELGVTGGGEIAAVEQVDTTPRSLDVEGMDEETV